MANAKKCDICGKYYDIYNSKLMDKKANGMQFIIKDTYNNVFICDNILDLCPRCMESINEHIKFLKINVSK